MLSLFHLKRQNIKLHCCLGLPNTCEKETPVHECLSNHISGVRSVTGEQPLKLAHSLLGSAVGITDINNGLDGQSLGSRHTEINLNKIYFPRKQLKYIIIF